MRRVSKIVPNLVAPMELSPDKNHIKIGKRFPNKPLSKKDAVKEPLDSLKLLGELVELLHEKYQLVL